MTTDEPWSTRVQRILAPRGLAMPEYYLLATAGYRVNLERRQFIGHAAGEFQGDGWPVFTADRMESALDRLLEARLMLILTEADLHTERTRRAASEIPELDDGIYHQAGHLDFTEAGYLLFRDVSRAILGDSKFARVDSGFNLDLARGRFDVYAVTRTDCQALMDQIQADGDSFTGAESTTFVGTDGPTEIGPWRPIRFLRCPAGYHGVLRFVTPSRPVGPAGR
jgi:hypothetical protein